ncbi:hypothetical protein C0J52_27478 [Blattella germanica]|nr:hypothetical protein C0J52_27478 [Blattella germanica]
MKLLGFYSNLKITKQIKSRIILVNTVDSLQNSNLSFNTISYCFIFNLLAINKLHVLSCNSIKSACTKERINLINIST